MISFKQHHTMKALLKRLARTSFGTKRKDMPQILGKDFEHFKQWLATQRITTFKKLTVPSQYKATQKDYNESKVVKLLKQGYQNFHNKHPIIVSRDNYVIDCTTDS